VTGSVVQAGRIDNVTVQSGEPVSTHPLLTSWQERPALPPQLRDLLEAQQRATESLPYKLLGVKQPELTHVYVQQHLRQQHLDRSPEPELRTTGETSERTLAIADAFDRTGHLMITGEPGSGKSTVGYMYTQKVSEYWLTADAGAPPIPEPVVPLRIPARALADNKSWSELLAAGAQEALGRLLGERPKAELFTQRALGARWLVFVDGLDEIIEPETRAQVIDALAHQIRRNQDQRLVITTRPLPGHELKPLVMAGVETYEIQPFGPVELADFARNWFQAQSPITARDRAAEFVRQVRDGRLRELVRNPLLATIAAIANTLEPDRPLPNSRVDLYERFMAYLLDDHPARRDALAELARTAHGRPERLRLIEWLHRHRTEIVERLAVHRLEKESSLLTAAYDWVRQNRDDLPDAWHEDLRALLAGTGVFVPAKDNLQFRHHSFAEFLAARHRAGTIPADFPDLDEWVERGLTEAKQAFALFTFVLWGRENNDLSRVLTTMLAGTKDKVLLAGRLLAEEIGTDHDLAGTVVGRLLDLLLANGARADPWDDVQEVGRVLGSFVPSMLGELVLARLKQLRDREEVAEAVRIECAVVLGRLLQPEPAAEWLREFMATASFAALERSAVALADLVPDGAERAERLLLDMATDAVTTMVVVSILLGVKRNEAAARLVRQLCGQLRTAAAGPLPLADSRVMDSWTDEPASWGVLAQLAARSDCHEEALWAAGRCFHQPDGDTFTRAVRAILSVRGADGVAEILAAAVDRPHEELLHTAEILNDDGHADDALELARHAVSEPHVHWLHFSRAARLFAKCAATTELLRLVEDHRHLGHRHVIHALRPLSNLSDVPNAVALLLDALADPTTDIWVFGYGVELLLECTPRPGGEEIRRLAARGVEFHAQAGAQLVIAGHVDFGGELLRELVDSGVDADTVLDIATDLADQHELPVVDALLDLAKRVVLDCSEYRRRTFVEALAEAGRREDAAEVARRIVLDDVNSELAAACVKAWLNTVGAEAATDILDLVLARDVAAKARLAFADGFAEAGLLEAAVTLWLDVVRHHGAAVDQGVAAAACLVRCGRRDDVLATIGDAPRLRALRAWVMA
jgi:hypothetical protein